MQQELLDLKINEIKSAPDPLAQARIVSELRNTYHIPGVTIAHALGYKPSHISHLLRVLKLPDMIIDGYVSKQVSFTHLIIISRLKKIEDIEMIYEEILTRNYTIADTEHRVRELLYQVTADGDYLSKDKLSGYESRIASSLGADVSIVQTRIKCKVTIELNGNLEVTTQFLEDLGSRFRSKRKMDKERSVDEMHTTQPAPTVLRRHMLRDQDQVDNKTADDGASSNVPAHPLDPPIHHILGTHPHSEYKRPMIEHFTLDPDNQS